MLEIVQTILVTKTRFLKYGRGEQGTGPKSSELLT
jgi:hypothetical protein